jgi:hypothetical protein
MGWSEDSEAAGRVVMRRAWFRFLLLKAKIGQDAQGGPLELSLDAGHTERCFEVH